MNKRITGIITLVLWAVCSATFAEDKAPLGFGDEAPALTELQWLKGSDPMAVESNKPAYLVYDCWATWCRPCIQTIPHLSELAENYADKGVAIVGVAVWDKLDAVKTFVEKNGAEMKYPVAFDAGEYAGALMVAAQQKSIPCVFVLEAETRVILWFGHPMMLGDILERITAGNYDSKKEAQRVAFEKMLQEAVQDQDWLAAADAVNEWKKVDPADAAPYDLWIQIQQQNEVAACSIIKQLMESKVADAEIPNVMGLLVLAADRFSESAECKNLVVDCARTLAADSSDPQIM